MGSRHWSSSDLVDWLRAKVFKIEKPTALGWGEWDDWYHEVKTNHPIGYWVTETLPDLLEKIPAHSIDYLDNVRHYVSNYRYGTHCLTSNLPRGKWAEFETRILHSLFDSYVDFIEIETAGSYLAWSDKETIAKYKIPFWYRHRWLDWGKKFRCPEAGLDHLRWEMTLDQPDPNDPNSGPNGSSPHQAVAAREKMELYTWWKVIRPTRGSSWEETGFQKFWDDMDKKYGSEFEDEPGKGSGKGRRGRRRGSWLGLGGKSTMTAAEKRKYKALSKAADDLQQQWTDEDEMMMIRLIKVRQTLWT
jgi:hypothetical protein